MPIVKDPMPTSDAAAKKPGHGVSWNEAVRTFASIGLNSFGGPAGQIAVMHKVLVEQKRWISEERFLHALNYCMLLPGPEAMQLLTYVGWLLHGAKGGLVAGLLFVLPGFISILALSVAYTTFRDVSIVEGLLFGLKAATLVIVIEAVVRIGKRVLKNGVMYAIAALAFVAIFFYQVPFPAIVGGAALLGLIGGRIRPDLFAVMKPRSENVAGAALQRYATDGHAPEHARPSTARLARTILIWGTIWLGPVVGVSAWLGRGNIFATLGEFFSKAAVVTFGGAYAVLAYIGQQAVERYGWLEPGEMLTGLGMAETTPGPLIQVVQFVGYMGAYRDPGSLHPLVAGVIASIWVTWVTYTPCFLWIFAGAPYVEHVRGMKSLSSALSCITAAIVGVILNLSVWFGVHTLFREVSETSWLGARLMVPRLSTIDWMALGIAAASAFVLFRLHWGVLKTLALAVGLSAALFIVRSAIG